MRALVISETGELNIQEMNKPRYNEYQALVKTIACGMCGTDIKLIHRCFKGFPQEVYPAIIGHEGVGRVVEVGSKVTSFKVGDIVMLPFVDPDPENLPGLGSCWGAMSEYGVVNDPKAPNMAEVAPAQTVLESDIDPIDAVMIVTFREILSTIKYFGIKPGSSVVVFGCGPVGLTFIKLMSLMGVEDIIACDIIDDHLAQAKGFGAKYLINNKEKDVVKEVRALFPKGVDYCLDAVGATFLVNQCMYLVKDRGAVLNYGIPEKEEITLDYSPADYNFRIIWQRMPRKDEEGAAHPEIVKWIREGKLNLKDFISDYYDFEDCVDAYDKLCKNEIMRKGIIVFEK